jgi:hypothetical protein
LILGAGLISKLQNKNTRIIEFGFGIFGLLESLVVLYLLYSYYTTVKYSLIVIYLILAGLGSILILNIASFISLTYMLKKDKKFNIWLSKSPC